MILLLQSVREAQRVTMGLAAHTQPPPFGAYPIRVLGAPGCFSGKMVSENTHFQKAERPPIWGMEYTFLCTVSFWETCP